MGLFSKILGCAALIGAVAGERALGVISLVETPEPINATLAADGWIGVKLTLVADAASGLVIGMDFKNNITTGTPSAPGWLFDSSEPIGISGPIHQAWSVSGEDGVSATPTGLLSTSGHATDSTFLNTGLYLGAFDPFTEDNNLAAGGDGTSFGLSPLKDTVNANGDGVDYGVGSLMTYSGAVSEQKALVSMDIAFLIIPAGTGDVHLRGVAVDGNINLYAFDQVLNRATFGSGSSSVALQPFTAVAVPEAGTLGIGVGMVGAMVMRKRRRILNCEC